MSTSSAPTFPTYDVPALRKGAFELSPTAAHLSLWPQSRAAELPKFLKGSWEGARKSFEEKLKALESKKDGARWSEQKSLPSLEVGHTEGGTWSVLLVPEKISTYALHLNLRQVASKALASGQEIRLDLSALPQTLQAEALNACVSLRILQQWKAPRFGQKESPKEKSASSFTVSTTLESLTSIAQSATQLALATNEVRSLAELPSNHLNPALYRAYLEKAAPAEGLGFEFWGRDELKKKGAGLFLAVTQADPKDAGGIARLSYRAKNAQGKILLVGKGVCFDTGGYDVKISGAMHGMQRDMTGSAVAWALVRALKRLEAPFDVEAYLALGENLISPTGYHPNEVYQASNGLAVEIVNTDAEGRMLLADTLNLASHGGGDLLLDFATLTGTCVRALDTRRAGIFSNRAELLTRGFEAGEKSGERVWPFPLGEDYEEALESKVADTLQCATGKNADQIYAATFLNRFVNPQVPWLHMDLSTDTNGGGLGLVASETTGFGVRWAMEVIRDRFHWSPENSLAK